MIRTLSAGSYRDAVSVTDLCPGDLAWLDEAVAFRVRGWSMFPTLRHGDVLEVVAAEPVAVGDLVLFRHGRALICHRVLALPSPDTVRTRGDGVAGAGEIVRREDLAGKVAGIRRGGRTIDPKVPHVAGLLARSLRSLVGLGFIAGDGARRGAEILLMMAKGILAARMLRPLTVPLLRRVVSFSLGYPAPFRVLSAYHFVPIGRRPIPWDDLLERLGGAAARGPGILLARLGWIPLGTLDPRTGSMDMRRAVAGLGVENELRAVAAEWAGLSAEGPEVEAQRGVGVRTHRSTSGSSSN